MRRAVSKYTLLGWLSLLLLVAGVASSCGTQKRVTSGTTAALPTLSKREFLKAYSHLSAPVVVDAKGTITMNSDGKTNFSSPMRWSLARDSLFVLSVRPLGLVEALRMTVSEEHLVILDRINRRGFTAEDPSLLYQTATGVTGFDVAILKSIAQQEPFSLLHGSGVGVLRQMDFARDSRYYRFEERDRRSGALVVHLFSPALVLVESQFRIPNVGEIRVAYGAHEYLDGPLFATPVARQTDVTLTLISEREMEQMRLKVELDDLRRELSQQPDTELPSRYQRLTIQEILRSFRE
ncbi:MAG: DUF4292 domain-containing protein [Porphyromonas sp.]|nr:DUF4292 domain-containing protein [Porphyromonas sp.]